MISTNTNHRWPKFVFPSRPTRRRQMGFSMIEVLCVILIIVLMGVLVGPSLMGPRATSITTSGTQIMEDLAYARELAIANNQPTEVWFLRPTGGTFILATQLYLVDQTGASTSYGAIHSLPASVGIDAGSTLSPLFVTANKKVFGGSVVQPPITGYQTNYDAWFIRFMPDGSTTLSTTQQWYLTAHDIALGNALSAVPPNYAMVSIDPIAGNVSLYRP